MMLRLAAPVSRQHSDLKARVQASFADGDRGVALMSVMLFMILLSGMSLVLLSVILGQLGPAFAAQKATKTVYAAQGGLQAALGVLRTAASAPDASGKVYGALNLLPCQISGSIDGASGDVSYTVDVSYYLTDPTGQTDVWLAQAANKLPCASPGGLSTQPKFAYLTSRGTGVAMAGRSAAEGNRAVAAIYKFQVSNVNIPSGRILDFAKTNCLQAQLVGGVVKAGSEVRILPVANCTNPERELWIYGPTYQLQLASSVEAGTPLCISGPADVGVASQKVTLVACATAATPMGVRYKQLWSWVGSHTWAGQTNPPSKDPSSFCLSSLTEAGDKFLSVMTPCTGPERFAPSLSVGSGAAGKTTNQIVNYKEFGRCVDVTDEHDWETFMIVYPCKQDPATTNGAYVNWNHKWYYNEPTTGSSLTQTVTIKTSNAANAATKCLLTPDNTLTGKYVTFADCASAGAIKDRQRWTRVNDTGVYADSFLFKDFFGRCMTADSTDQYQSNWSKITVVACDASLGQKWNAPPTYDTATFGSFRELG